MPALHYSRKESKKTRRERKRIKRKIQSILLISSFIISIIVYLYNNYNQQSSNVGDSNYNQRQLLEVDDDYYINSLDEFPPLLFSYDQIKNGWWLLNLVGMFYCFLGIAIICDDYFVPAIEVIVVRLEMSEDTAGATWMAAGGSAPELFTSFVGTFIAQSDVGFGTIVGSAVFNVLFIVGACAIFTSGNLKLQWWPFARDMSYYLICLSLLAIFFGGISKNQMLWWESSILLAMYLLYVFIMTQNQKLKDWFFAKFVYPNAQRDKKRLLSKDHETTLYESTEISMQEKKPKSPPYLRDEDLSRSKVVPIDEDDHLPPIDSESGASHSLNTYGNGLVPKKEETDDDDKSDDDDDDDSEEGLDLTFPDTFGARIWYIIKMPLTFPIYYTLFDVSDAQYEDWWPWTFFGSLFWLGGLSYLMVWWCVVVGYAWDIPQELMGLIFLAAGTSVPELFSCIIVAKKGQADMAVSASIGSNIFDILVGLPLPWLLFAISQSSEADEIKIDVQAHSLLLSIVVLMFILFCLLIIILINKWVLTHCMGYSMMMLYLVFIGQDLIRHYTPLDIDF